MKVFTSTEGSTPLLVSMPHNGEWIPPSIAADMHPFALEVRDTDWKLDRLYSFLETMEVSVVAGHISRYVIDLNRPTDGSSLYPGADTTELCPTSSFDKESIYQQGQEPDPAEIRSRVQDYWRPYHSQLQAELQRIRQEHGYALLLDAHTIASRVPRFFDGQLPDFNLGTNDGNSCDPDLERQLTNLDFSPYSQVCNGRFKGGYITRAYGDPNQNVHAVQLELSQATYMDEALRVVDDVKLAEVQPQLEKLVQTLLQWSPD